MQSRLIRLGDKGFNLNVVAGWRYQTHPEFPNERVLYLYLSGVYEPLCFEGAEAEMLQKLLNTSAQRITSENFAKC